MVRRFVNKISGAGGAIAAVERVGDGKRLQEWRVDQTACETAAELANFFKLKNYSMMTVERYSYLLGTPSWERHFDPFTGTRDGKKIVIRTEWHDAFMVEVNKNRDSWSARKTTFDECEINTGWKLIMPWFYHEFIRNSSKQMSDAVSFEEYCTEWLSEGTMHLREWGEWMHCVRSRAEANSWQSIGALPSDATNWTREGWKTCDAIGQIQLMLKKEADSLTGEN
jgi:hypothetical protein